MQITSVVLTREQKIVSEKKESSLSLLDVLLANILAFSSTWRLLAECTGFKPT